MLDKLKLLTLLRSKTIGDVDADLVTAALDLIGIKADGAVISKVIALASSEDPTADLIPWLEARVQDGSFQNLVDPNSSKVLHRCPHCECPLTIDLKDFS